MSLKLSANSSLSLPELPTVNTFYDLLRICSEGPVPSQCIKSTTLVENEIASDDYTGFRNEQLLICQMTEKWEVVTGYINKAQDNAQEEASTITHSTINRGAQNVASVVAWWCLWRVQRGPSGPVRIVSFHFGFTILFTMEFGYKVALQWRRRSLSVFGARWCSVLLLCRIN